MDIESNYQKEWRIDLVKGLMDYNSRVIDSMQLDEQGQKILEKVYRSTLENYQQKAESSSRWNELFGIGDNEKKILNEGRKEAVKKVSEVRDSLLGVRYEDIRKIIYSNQQAIFSLLKDLRRDFRGGRYSKQQESIKLWER